MFVKVRVANSQNSPVAEYQQRNLIIAGWQARRIFSALADRIVHLPRIHSFEDKVKAIVFENDWQLRQLLHSAANKPHALRWFFLETWAWFSNFSRRSRPNADVRELAPLFCADCQCGFSADALRDYYPPLAP